MYMYSMCLLIQVTCCRGPGCACVPFSEHKIGLDCVHLGEIMNLPPPTRLRDFEAFAKRSMPAQTYEYYRSGAYPEQTLRDNELAFQRYRLRPNTLRDVSNRDLRTTVLGQEIAFPVAIAPTALHRLAHNDGELATARAATSMGTGMVLSTYTSTPMEDVAAAASPNGLLWAQTTAYRDEEVVRQTIQKAEKKGYKALFVSLDAKMSRRKAGPNLMPPHIRFANFEGERSRSFTTVERNSNPKLTWERIDWLKSLTTLPIVAKGVLSAATARDAMKHKVAGIVVSNHGARVLDGSLATIDVLAEVVEAVRGSGIEVYLDGGVRSGTDVLKALALGARAVFIGRPVLWGLAYDGQEGVRKVLQIIRDEFSQAMGLAECASLSDITPSLVVRDPQYTCSCARTAKL
ncbi:hydroxyacid oxidase 1-like [Acanthaster planci]|uniref:(S)-2-hydroxy-acid oxidase n=1 Tax=Acanthaster planci TaxID=133434 RepID=A0A8B7YRW4_ACAPL|nr:hydroxyacid oxidase 1-like [Acanthaster planci]